MKIITRGDFDGLVCCVLLTEAEKIDGVRFVHPKQMQDRIVEVTGEDIIVNLPYHPSCGMWFDHHISEMDREQRPEGFKGRYGLAPSCARLVYEYYAMPQWERYAGLMADVDKIDSAQLTLNDILRPEGWVKLANTVDPRTGFGSSHDFFQKLIEWIRELPIEDILAIDEVKDRTREFYKQQIDFEGKLKKHSYINGAVVVTDFRPLQETPVGSRFLVYALYPTANVSVRVFYGGPQGMVTIAVGHSILNRTCAVDVGNLLAGYGGGGHAGAGSCGVASDKADDVIMEIVERLNAN
ncbi:MAG: exopolyphosphatase [Nitrospinae bacterium]|nr:exopolyphosphatase [Nitrospinota bacterium]